MTSMAICAIHPFVDDASGHRPHWRVVQLGAHARRSNMCKQHDSRSLTLQTGCRHMRSNIAAQ